MAGSNKIFRSLEMNVQMCQSSFYYAPQIFSFNFYTQLLVSPSPTHSCTLAPLHFPDQYKVPVSAVDLLIDDNPKKKNQRNVKLCCQIFWLGSSSDKRQSEDFFLNIKSCPWAAHISSAEPASDVTKIFLTSDCSTTAPHCTDCQLSVEISSILASVLASVLRIHIWMCPKISSLTVALV